MPSVGPSRTRATIVRVMAKGGEMGRMARVGGLQLVDRKKPAERPPSPREASDLDAAARLERAARLRDAGVITEEDFANLKSRYLEEL